jgi:hypothetical protein
MIEDYLNQVMTHRRRTAISFNGDKTFEATPNVPCRWEQSRRLVRNDQGEEVLSEATVLTQATVQAGDELIDPAGRTWPVLTVSTMPDLDGNTMFLEVALSHATR